MRARAGGDLEQAVEMPPREVGGVQPVAEQRPLLPVCRQGWALARYTTCTRSHQLACIACSEEARTMPELYGRRYRRAELLERVGRLDQIGGIEPCVLAGGL